MNLPLHVDTSRMGFNDYIRDPHGRLIATVEADEDHTRAAFIVTACNAHDDLVAALERVGKTNLYGVLCFCGSIWSAHSDACDQANAALKLAREAQP